MRTTVRMGGFLATALVVLSGCMSGPAPIDHFYRIEIQAPSQPAAQRLPGTLHVDRFRTEALTAERPILYRKSTDRSEIRQHPYHRWSDPLPILLQTELVSFLDAARAADFVMPAGARVHSDYQLTGYLHEFDRVLVSGAQVVIEIQFTLTDSEGSVLLHKLYQEERAAANSEVAASVDAFSEAVHAIFSRFLADLSSLSNTPPAS